jgi:hypothetical protein
MRRLRNRIGCAVGVALLAISAFAPSALAYTDHWYAGDLAKDFGFASTAAHSITFIQGVAYNDTICVGAEQGTAGSYYDAPFFSDCQMYSSGGTANAYYNGACCFHATVIYGGPASSKTILSSTHYDF